MPFITVGTAGAIFFGWFSFATQSEVDAFARDGSCTRGFTIAAAPPNSLCSVRKAAIVPGSAERRAGRRSVSYYVSLNLGGGRVDCVRLVTFAPQMWVEMRSGGAVAVRAHLFRDNVDAFESSSGIATTSDRPNPGRSSASAFAAVFFGAVALWGALRLALRRKCVKT